jgi:hypothetical protein
VISLMIRFPSHPFVLLFVQIVYETFLYACFFRKFVRCFVLREVHVCFQIAQIYCSEQQRKGWLILVHFVFS